jgi:hypothetical protein
MSIYRVEVRCNDDKRVIVRRTFLVEAEDSEDAKTQAERAAEDSAEFGPRWVEFQWIECSRASLPFELRL